MEHALLIEKASMRSKAMETGALLLNFGAMGVSIHMESRE
jgi:hypothetical protein